MSHLWQDTVLLFQNINPLAAIFLLAGVGLLIFEIFTPGFHAPGLTGLLLVVLGMVLGAKSLFDAVLLLAIILVLLIIAFIAAVLSASRGRLYRSPLVLKAQQSRTEGYLSADDMRYLIGRQGQASSMLRPAGTGEFDGVRLDVVADGQVVERGRPIEITAVEGRRIVVREVRAELKDI